MSATEAATLLGVTQSRISNIEAGRYGVSGNRVRALARNYACSDQALIDALAGMTGDRTRGWWEEYQDLLPTGLLELTELEHHATALRTSQLVNVPGLLQTPDHARSIFGQAVPPLLPHEVEHMVAHRIRRQGILHRQRPTPYTAVLHEAALHMRFGGTYVAKAQLRHLIELSEHENITILVIPFTSDGFPPSGHGIDYFSGPVSQLDTVQLDTTHGSELVDAPAKVEMYRLLLDRMEEIALPAEESRDLMNRAAQRL
ncbi:DNA-binding protein [Wenjunlia vitaminophila]|uniref:DNA-binding protein n=1 Tax=Wenjunlia vitaminophila TaxID=76728 RepID=A0A0T6LZ90_WENVI|nr:DNA-binding protein [Wenjunlia vitaminophila]